MASNEQITISLHVNGRPVEQELQKLEQHAAALRSKMDKAFTAGDTKQYRNIEKELRLVEKQAERVVGEHRRLNQTLNNLSAAKPKELRAAMKRLNDELSSPAIKRGSEEWNKLQAQLSRVRSELKQISDESRAASTTIGNRASEFGKSWVGLTTITTQAIDAVSRIKNFADEYVNAYAEMAEAEANVEKYTGLTRAEVEQLNEAFKGMDTRTSREQLNALAADAGRLGITGTEGVLSFVQAADMINVALGEDLGEEAVKNIGKLAQLFGDADRMGLKQAMLATGSTINALGQSSSAAESYIVNFTARLAGAANQAKMTQPQVMALAAVLDQSMLSAEVASTALSRILQVLYRDTGKMAKAVGLDVQQFTQTLHTDANTALLQFSEAVSRLGGMEKIAPMLGEIDLTGSGVSSTLAALAQNIDLVRTTQAQAAEEFQNGTSILVEFGKANSTPQAELEKTRGRINDLRVELGEMLLPIMESSTKAFQTAAKYLIDNRTTVAALTATFAALAVAVNLVTIRQKAAAVATTLYTAIAGTSRIITEALRVLYYRWTGQTVALTAAQTALNAAMAANPIGAVTMLILTLIAALGAWKGMNAMLGNSIKDTNKAIEEQGNAAQRAEAKAAQSTAEEKSRIRELVAILKSNTAAYDLKRQAINKLNEIVPGFHKNIKDGTALTQGETKAIKDYIVQLDNKAKAEAYYAIKVETERKLAEANLTAERKRRNIQAVNTEISSHPNLYKQEATTVFTDRKTGFSEVRYVDNDALAEQKRRRKIHENALQAAEEEIAHAENDLRLITQLVNQNQGIATEYNNLLMGGNGGSSSGGSSSGGSSSGGTSNTNQDAEEKVRRKYDAERLIALTAYRNGITDRREYETEMLDIENRYLTEIRDLYEKGTAEWNAAETRRLQQEQKDMQTMNAMQAEQIDERAEAERQAARENYANGKMDYQAYQDELNRIRQQALRDKAAAARAWGNEEEAAALELQLEEDLLNEKLAKRRNYEQQAAEMQRQYLEKSIEERRQAELTLLKTLIKEGVISPDMEATYTAQINKKFDEEAANQNSGTGDKKETADLGQTNEMGQSVLNLQKALENLHNNLENGTATWQDYAAVAVASLGIVSSTLSAASQLMQANQQAEEAKITARYDKEIEAAGTGTKRAKQLEEQKQKELAQVKKKYNERSMKIEIAQAVAQTAQAAIAAYASAAAIPVTGWIMAPIAAAMALAAGAIQIATIKKQHAAETAGYYEGGFTGGNQWDEEAGIVHQGEFVANHKAVRNPALRPVLNLIDHAQRNNTIARLTEADLSRSIGARTSASNATTTASAPTAVTLTESTRTAETLDRLTTAIEQGINATVVLDGQDGFEQKWKHYQRLKSRK